ncbi:MAG: Uma2 family endonuclease [Dehalococcoidia bacterium]
MTISPVSSEDLLTADEFWELPEAPHGGRMELVAGRVVTEMPVGEMHAHLAVKIAALLLQFVTQHKLGRVYVELGHRLFSDPDTVRAPDVSFSRRAEGSPIGVRYIDEAPALAIEIISPDDRESDVALKVEEYFDAGSERVWIVRPSNQTITVHRPGGDAHTYTRRDTLTSDDAAFAVNGFELNLEQFFADR